MVILNTWVTSSVTLAVNGAHLVLAGFSCRRSMATIPSRFLQKFRVYIGHPPYLGDFSMNIGCKWIPRGFSRFVVHKVDSHDT